MVGDASSPDHTSIDHVRSWPCSCEIQWVVQSTTWWRRQDCHLSRRELFHSELLRSRTLHYHTWTRTNEESSRKCTFHEFVWRQCSYINTLCWNVSQVSSSVLACTVVASISSVLGWRVVFVADAIVILPGRPGLGLHVLTAEGVLTLTISSAPQTCGTVCILGASKFTNWNIFSYSQIFLS